MLTNAAIKAVCSLRKKRLYLLLQDIFFFFIPLFTFLGVVIIQLIIAPILTFEPNYIYYIWTLHLDELFIFILVACAELILMIDQWEYTGV